MNFLIYKGKYEIQVGLVAECAKKKIEIEALHKKVEGAEAACKYVEDLANKATKLKREKKDHESPGANKPEDLVRLDLVGLISKIEEV